MTIKILTVSNLIFKWKLIVMMNNYFIKICNDDFKLGNKYIKNSFLFFSLLYDYFLNLLSDLITIYRVSILIT